MTAAAEQSNVFNRVLFVGPDPAGRGGIAAVLTAYRDHLPIFRMVSTNSHRGRLAGLMVFGYALLRLPFLRFFWPHRDVLHVHGASEKSFARKRLIIALSKALGYKIVYHIHGGAFKEFTAQKGRQNVLKTLNRCDAIVCLSPEWHRFFAEELGCKNVHIVNNMIPEPVKAPASSPRPQAFTFVFLGTINQEKGVFDLVKAVGRIQDRLRGMAKFVIAGSGEDAALLQTIAQNGVSDIMDFKGWFDAHAKAELLSHADALILPSYIEGLPICILEAMSYGLTVIATPVGGIPSVIHDGRNGLLVKPGDIDSLSEAIERVIADSDLRNRSAVDSPKAVQRHLPNAIKEQLETVYQSI